MRCFTYEYLERNGRLGNQLWQIAATIGMAVAAPPGADARFPPWEYRPYFSVPGRFFDAPPAGAEIVDGGTEYFQQTAYFDFMADDVRAMFQPSPLAEAHLHQHYPEFFSVPSWHKTAIHVRRGDYLKNPHIFPPCTAKYYQAATAAVPADTTFVLFSDDIPWCLANLDYLGLAGRPLLVIRGVERPVEVADRKGEPADQWDLFLMSKCDEHIISNSTFSWWGAYLSNNRHPYYPSVWFGPSIVSTVHPKEWKMIEC